MPVLTWNDDYSVGNETIDFEHKALIDMINEAHDAVDTTDDRETLVRLIDDMREYARQHFVTEEQLMAEHAYPKAAPHIAAHQTFLEKVNAGTDAFAADAFSPGTVKLLAYLADWLVKHMMHADKELGAFLQERDVR